MHITWSLNILSFYEQNKNIHQDSLRECSGHFLWVTVDCMEEPGEAQAKHSTQEKHPEHHFLLQRSHEWYIWPQHGQSAQTEEKDQAWGKM